MLISNSLPGQPTFYIGLLWVRIIKWKLVEGIFFVLPFVLIVLLLKNNRRGSVMNFIQGIESKLNMSFTVRALRDTDKKRIFSACQQWHLIVSLKVFDMLPSNHISLKHSIFGFLLNILWYYCVYIFFSIKDLYTLLQC